MATEPGTLDEKTELQSRAENRREDDKYLYSHRKTRKMRIRIERSRCGLLTTFFERERDRLIICRAGIFVHSREIPYCDDDVAINVYRCHKYERPSEPKVYDTCQFLLNFFKQTVLSRFFLHRRFIKLYRKASEAEKGDSGQLCLTHV